MKQVLMIIQLVIAVVLSILILMQAKGTGIGRAFGGAGSYHSRRGVETLVFRSTIILASLFVVLSIVNQLVL